MKKTLPSQTGGKAYSYIRFSRSIQGKEDRDSLRRQTEKTREFCRAHGLQLVEEMTDLGVSSFKGKNLEESAKLGFFLKRVKEGKIPTGSTLCVESFDRISRDKILVCQSILMQLLLNGIAIAPLSFNGQILTEESVNANPTLLILAIVESMRGGNESTHKSERINENFQQKIQNIKLGKRIYFGGCMPGWITGVKDDKWTIHQERVSFVKRIYKEYLEGSSLCSIARKFNEDYKSGKISPIGMKHNKKVLWHQGSIKIVLTNEAVTGTFGMKGLEPIKNYLPTIISQADFDRVQVKLNQNTTRKGGSELGNVRNLFATLTKCKCGKAVSTNGGTVKGKDYFYYRCTAASEGACDCTNHVRVDDVERIVFEGLLGKKPSDYLSADAKQELEERETWQAKATMLEKKINAVSEMLKDDDCDFTQIRNQLKEFKTQKAEIEKTIKQLSTKQTTLETLPSVISDLGSLVIQDLSNNEVRKQIVNLMPSVIKDITFNLGEKLTWTVNLVNGYSTFISHDAYNKSKKR